MLWKQAPPIRLGQQANKRGQDQHDEGFRHCLLHRRNTIMSVACFDHVCWRTSRSWEGRLGCARKEQQEWSAKPWNCESLKNNLCHIHLIMMFKMIFWSQAPVWRCLLIGSSWQCSGWRCFDPEKNISSCYQRYLRARESDSYQSIPDSNCTFYIHDTYAAIHIPKYTETYKWW